MTMANNGIARTKLCGTRYILCILCLVVLATSGTAESDEATSSSNQKGSLRGLSLTDVLAPQPRIINGQDADQDRFPYYSLMYGSSMCGAVLIGPRLVLSAAHCSGSDNQFRVGARSSTSDGETISIKDFIIHPGYVPSRFDKDIMMFFLDEATDQPYIQLEPLEISGGTLTVIGFGDTDAGPSITLASVLQEVDVDYVDSDLCDADNGGNGVITDDMLCAAAPNRDSCAGDSGGPLFIKGENYTSDRLVGLVSWGRGCAIPGYPGVYTRISYFFDWIVQTACQNFPDDAPSYMNCSASARTSSTDYPTFSPTLAPSSVPTNRPTVTMAPTTTTVPTSMPVQINQLKFVAWTPKGLLKICQGDCDTDDDCEGDLTCFQRNGGNATIAVPGCVRPDLIQTNIDICINMTAGNDIP